jgi:hypothetical protein
MTSAPILPNRIGFPDTPAQFLVVPEAPSRGCQRDPNRAGLEQNDLAGVNLLASERSRLGALSPFLPPQLRIDIGSVIIPHVGFAFSFRVVATPGGPDARPDLLPTPHF